MPKIKRFCILTRSSWISRTIDIIDPHINNRNSAKAWIDGRFDPNVALIKIAPGLKPELLDSLPDLGYKGVVIQAYGAGNMPIENRSLLEPIQRLVKRNIPVIISL